METIQNTQLHTYQGLLVSPFGSEGAVHLVPLDNGKPRPAIILDADAVSALVEALVSIQADVPTFKKVRNG